MVARYFSPSLQSIVGSDKVCLLAPLAFPQQISHLEVGPRRVEAHRSPDHKSPSVERRNMAIPEFTRESKDVYRLIVVLNGYLRFIIAQLEQMSKSKILSPDYIKEMTDLTQEVQTALDKYSKENE
jgi:hypothetical protein